MTNSSKTGIYYRQGLAADELADVHDLVRASEDYDKLDLRVSVAALAATAPRPRSRVATPSAGGEATADRADALGPAAHANGHHPEPLRPRGIDEALKARRGITRPV